MQTPRIDSHQHYWRYDPVHFAWLEGPLAKLRRDFLPEDLQPVIGKSGIDKTVAVQAPQTLDETRWLLSLAAENNFIAGVVGWVPLTDPDINNHLDGFAEDPKLVGMRHILQGEESQYMWGPAFNQGVDALGERDLAYDVLVFHHQLPQALEFIDRHPNQRLVLDHIAKPNIREGQIAPWDQHMRTLAERPNLWCKLSGVVTEADPTNWTIEQIKPYMDLALEAFGPSRVMFGSDWPVCKAGIEYGDWHDTVQDFIRDLSQTEQARIMGGNAIEAYKLQVQE